MRKGLKKMKKNIITRIAIAVLVVLGVAAASYMLVVTPTIDNIHTVQENIDKNKNNLQDTKALEEEKNRLTEQNTQLLSDISKRRDEYQKYDAMTTEEVLTFISESSQMEGLSLVAFYDYGTEDSGQSWQSDYDIEVKGSLNGIRNFIQSIDRMNMRYSIGSASLAELTPSIDGVSDYTTRYFDDLTSLPWYAAGDGSAQIGRTDYKDLSPFTSATNKPASASGPASASQQKSVKDMAKSPEHDPEAAEKAALQAYDGSDGIIPGYMTNNGYKAALLANTVKVTDAESNVNIVSDGLYKFDFTIKFSMYKNPETKEAPPQADNTVH